MGNPHLLEALSNVPAHSPRSYYEALVMMRLINFTLWLNGNKHNTLGRFDVYMYPYFQSDIERGTLTSADALALARENARRLGAEVEFRQADILQEDAWTALGTYDMVVSNPPYVRESEREQMHDNVRRYEPSLALFVPDEDPLRFYRAIGRFAFAGLAAGGRLYFEINRAFGRQTAELLAGLGFAEVEGVQDINGGDRMVRAVKKGKQAGKRTGKS